MSAFLILAKEEILFGRKQMNLFESVRGAVTAREAAEHYGLKVKRNGMAVCPFHNDRDPSMKLDLRYHCFGCGADGDAIDFVGRYFGLKPAEAARKLAEDFGISYEDTRNRQTDKKAQKRSVPTVEQKAARLEKKLNDWLRHAADVLLYYRGLLKNWEENHRPGSPEDEWHPLFCEALQNKTKIDYYLDCLLCGDEKEQLDFSAA